MAGLKGLFSRATVQRFLDEKMEAATDKVLEALQYEGELFVNKARLGGNYKDQTGNLRSSIGYLILKDGKVIDKNFQGDKARGKEAGIKAASEVANDFPKGYVLIGVAGMNYAAAVESKGYDVITGSAPGDNEIKDLLGAIKF